MSFHIIDNINGNTQAESISILEEKYPALLNDATLTSKPVSSKLDDIYTPNQIKNKFDSITYSKGGHIIRMMEKFVGEDNFKNSLRNYLSDKYVLNDFYLQIIKMLIL